MKLSEKIQEALRQQQEINLSDPAVQKRLAAQWGYVPADAQPMPSDEYSGWYCAHCERGVDASEVTYHEQHEGCGRVITDDKPSKPAPSVPEGWLRAIDEALVVAHIGVASASDTYEQAREKLNNLIGFHMDVATDPAVNGGWKLVPTAESRHPGIYKMLGALHAIDNTRGASEWESYAAMLAVAPEAKL